MKKALLITAIICGMIMTRTANAQAPPFSLWYNGDFDGLGYHANEINTSSSNSQVFDDFFVPAGVWNVTAVFSDDLLSTVVTGAVWEIRQGVSPGNEGTIVASGTTDTPTVTATGRSGFGYNEFAVEVTGLSGVALVPGHYWLTVTPIGNGTGRSLNTTTSGTNCVGMPCGNNGESWFRPEGPIFSPLDFSMGVIGTDLVPEPGTLALLTSGLGALLIAVRRRRAA